MNKKIIAYLLVTLFNSSLMHSTILQEIQQAASNVQDSVMTTVCRIGGRNAYTMHQQTEKCYTSNIYLIRKICLQSMLNSVQNMKAQDENALKVHATTLATAHAAATLSKQYNQEQLGITLQLLSLPEVIAILGFGIDWIALHRLEKSIQKNLNILEQSK